MAKYYLCNHEECKLAFPEYKSFIMHYNGKHSGEAHCTKEDCEVDELLEGYILKDPKPKPAVEIVLSVREEGVTPKGGAAYRQLPNIQCHH